MLLLGTVTALVASSGPTPTKVDIDWDAVKVRTATAATVEVRIIYKKEWGAGVIILCFPPYNRQAAAKDGWTVGSVQNLSNRKRAPKNGWICGITRFLSARPHSPHRLSFASFEG